MIDKNSNNSVNKIKIKYILVRYPRRELHFFFFWLFRAAPVAYGSA